jgi:hypothetical protein
MPLNKQIIQGVFCAKFKFIVNMPVKERLTEYLKSKKISKSAFGRDIGVSSAYIASIRKSIQPDKLQRICLEISRLKYRVASHRRGQDVEIRKFTQTS